MTCYRMTTMGAVVVGVLLSGAAGLAQGNRGGGPGGPGREAGGRFEGLGLPVRDLNLSESQQQLIRNIRQQHLTTVQQLDERLREAATAQRTAVETVPLDEALIRSTSVALVAAQTDLAIERGRIYNEVWTVLTPEQQGQATKLQAERQTGQPGAKPVRERRKRL